MARGRRKDHTIPLSRGLIHQRDYRARKAKYVSDLEERCRHAEAENEKLRKELEIAKGGLPVRPAAYSSETTHAATELMQHLSAASLSLARFQQLAYTDSQPLSLAPIQSRPSIFPSPASPSSPFSPPTAISIHPPNDGMNPQISQIPESIDTSSNTNALHQPITVGTGSDEGECCGGLFDCNFVEDTTEEDREDIMSNPLVNDSNMRSTSDGTPTI